MIQRTVLKTRNAFRLICRKNFTNQIARNVSYVQGQEPEPKIREYFYYIDHQGMLRLNNTGRYKEFPYLSICGKERNFIRCDDYPIVFTHVLQKEIKGETETHLAYNHAGDLLTYKFEPNKIVMIPETGRVYHTAPERAGSIGLVRSKLAIEFSKFFAFNDGEKNPPTHFTFDGFTYELDNSWYKKYKTR